MDGVVVKKSIVGAALGAVLIAVGLSGCGEGNTKPTPSPTASVKELNASESPSETPTPEQKPTPPVDVDPPERPAAMDNADEAGAVAAAEYFLKLTGYAAASGSTVELKELSSADCEACKRMIETPTAFYEKGGWSEMPEITIDNPRIRLLSETPLQYNVELEMTRGAYEYFTEENGNGHVEPETLTMGFAVTRRESWEIDAIQASKPETSSSARGNE